jgi:hypothetical protein
VRGGHFHAVALEEPLVDRVQKVLLFAEVGDRGCGGFNCRLLRVAD